MAPPSFNQHGLVEHYGFPSENIVSLTEDEGKSDLRPTRANIAHEFKRLAEAASTGEQIVVFLAGHGDRQPESEPPDPIAPEPDGIDEIFLPADVKPWRGHPERVPNAITDKEIRDWLGAITAKKAYVWAIFDCCHSRSMTRYGENIRQLPTGLLVPPEEMAKARERAAKRIGRAVSEQNMKGQLLAPSHSDDYLVATFACREFETTPEGPQGSDAKWHGLFTYSLVGGLEQSVASGAPLTYRELLHLVQASYLAQPQVTSTPTVEGSGQVRVVLGTDKPIRPKLTLFRVKGEYLVNVGDLHGITPGSVLRVYSTAGEKEKPRVVGYVRVKKTHPLDSVVSAIAYEGTEKPSELPTTGLCEVVAVNYLISRLRVGIERGQKESDEVEKQVTRALRTLPKEEAGLFELVKDVRAAQFLVRVSTDGPQVAAASGDRPPIPLPALDSERFGEALTKKLNAIHRARALIEVGIRLEGEKRRGLSGPEVTIELLVHCNEKDPGQVLERPNDGWVFHTGDQFSFRITNISKSKLEVTILVVDPDYHIHLVYSGKALEPGTPLNTGIGTITPPFGQENMVVIITAPTNPPVNYELLTSPDAQDREDMTNSPLAQLLKRCMYGSGLRSDLTVPELENQGARVLSWRAEPAPEK